MRHFSHKTIGLLAAAGLATACGGHHDASSATTAPLADTCKVQLSPRAGPLASAAPLHAASAPTHPSRLVAHVELRLAPIAKELETKVPPRLAEERNHGIGALGHLNYTVDRGPFSIAVEGESLVIKTDVKAHAEACRGRSCYASCAPEGRATAAVPLHLLPEYRFASSHVTFAFTKGCEVRALGGALKLDVTPMLKDAIAPSLHRVEQEIDGKLPPLRPQAERLWAELGKTRPLPLGACVVTNPRGIVEGPASGTADALRVRFGVVAYPEIRSRCGDAPPSTSPLPPLAYDARLPDEDELVLALVSPLAVAAAGLEGDAVLDAGSARARIAQARATPSGAQAALDLGLRGEACGDLGVVSGFGWAEDGKTIRLAAPSLPEGERARVLAAALTPETFMTSLGRARMTPPIAPDTVKDLVPSIASSMSDPGVAVTARVDDVKPFDVVVRGEDLAASVLVRGSVELKQR